MKKASSLLVAFLYVSLTCFSVPSLSGAYPGTNSEAPGTAEATRTIGITGISGVTGESGPEKTPKASIDPGFLMQGNPYIDPGMLHAGPLAGK